MTRDALSTLIPIAGWDSQRAGEVEFSGDADPILPTPFRIGETAAASLAAVGLAVSDIWKLRTGRRQKVGIDVRQATASLRSSKYMTQNGKSIAAERHPLMGVYPAKNGRWSYLHCNFPNHRAVALSVLGVEEEDNDAVRKAVSKWEALELEEAIIAAGGAGGMVRSMEEWAQHPHASAVASLPLLEITKIADSPAGVAAGRRQAPFRHSGSRSDSRAGRPDVRPHPSRARRRRNENNRAAPRQHRLAGVRHRARQALGTP